MDGRLVKITIIFKTKYRKYSWKLICTFYDIESQRSNCRCKNIQFHAFTVYS